MRKLFLFLVLAVLAVPALAGNSKYVNPYIGSGGHGHVFVGANVPFGAVQLGPMNIYKGWDWCSGYNYSDSIIIGFNHTHLSGTGCSDLGDIGLMPYQGALRTAMGKGGDLAGAASSYFRHENETVGAGYYAVTMDNGVSVELTTTERVGIHHYTFHADDSARVLIDLVNGVGNTTYESYIHRIDDYTLEGYRFTTGWASTRKVFFYARFNKPIRSLRTFAKDYPCGEDELQSTGVKAVATLAEGTKDLMVKVSLSTISSRNARMNMEAEAPGWDFQALRQAAAAKWDDALACIDIDASPKDKEIFYTALYHMMIAPTLYCDVNGDFRGMDDRIYTDNKFKNYTTFSLWDTYRTFHPMLTILKPEMINDMMNSMLSIYHQNGKLPVWPLYMGETNTMAGYASLAVMADAYLKGFRGFPADEALRAMVSTATNTKQRGIKDFMQYGYIPADKMGEATSYSLEYAASDWGLALMARAMGNDSLYLAFRRRGESYKHFWDPRIQKIHPKMADGSWYEPYNPFLANHRDNVGDFTEGNGWEYTFMVPQDPEGLIALHGGNAAFVRNLDSLFLAEGDLGEGAPPDVSGMIGQYAHGNEPNHHIPYLYVYAGAPRKTQALVRRLMRRFYTAEPEGYAGNEDCGQMSAWLVSSALGLFQVKPSGGEYVLGSPLYKSATIHLPRGRELRIVAKNQAEEHVYVKKVRWRGRQLRRPFLAYEDLMQGGTLEFTME